MSGFGGAITDSSAVVLYRLSPAAREPAMRSLFDPRAGDGLSYLRQPIGASDFVANARLHLRRHAGRADRLRQRHFSIAHDEAEILPLLRKAKRLNPKLQIVATPVEPAGVDEDQRLADRRPADRQPAGSTTPTRCT